MHRAGLLLVIAGALLTTSWASAETAIDYVLLVKFKPDVETIMAREVIDRSGALASRPLSPQAPPGSASAMWWRAVYSTPDDLSRATARLTREPTVDRVERPEPVEIR